MSVGCLPPLQGEVAVRLCLPDDWLDLVLDDEQQIGREVDRAFAPADRDLVTQVLRTWRRRPGLLSYGMVEVHQDGLDATWQVLTSVVPVPHHPEIDPAAALSTLLGAASLNAYVEVFDTPDGRAVGLLEESETLGPDRTAAAVHGRAVVLALPHGLRLGLLVVGVCVDPAQLPELAALVTLIATRSTVTAA